MGEHKEGEVHLFSEMDSEKAQGIRHQPKQGKFMTDIRKNVFYCEHTSAAEKVPREGWESSALEINDLTGQGPEQRALISKSNLLCAGD